jgi:hypothetical protein
VTQPTGPIDAERVLQQTAAVHLKHFEQSDSRCRGMQLPDGLLLRYTLSSALFFYLRTGVDNGKLVTRAFASDTPYDWQKTPLGELVTPMFEESADRRHLEKVQQLLHSWIEFVTPTPDTDRPFAAFATGQSRT